MVRPFAFLSIRASGAISAAVSEPETDESGKDGSRREQILAAAESQVLKRNGLDLSLSEIAEELNVSRSLIYVYFESVSEIIDELFSRHARGLGGGVARRQRSL